MEIPFVHNREGASRDKHKQLNVNFSAWKIGSAVQVRLRDALVGCHGGHRGAM